MPGVSVCAFQGRRAAGADGTTLPAPGFRRHATGAMLSQTQTRAHTLHTHMATGEPAPEQGGGAAPPGAGAAAPASGQKRKFGSVYEMEEWACVNDIPIEQLAAVSEIAKDTRGGVEHVLDSGTPDEKAEVVNAVLEAADFDKAIEVQVLRWALNKMQSLVAQGRLQRPSELA